MQKHPKLLFFCIMFLATIVGTYALAPMLHVKTDTGGTIGVIIGFFASFFVPGLWKSLAQVQNEEQKQAFSEGIGTGFWKYLTHPTQLPAMLGLLWFIGFLGIQFLFHLKISSNQFVFILLPFPILFGLTGFFVFLRKEYINRPGHVIRGNWARVIGALIMIFCWGASILMLLTAVFG